MATPISKSYSYFLHSKERRNQIHEKASVTVSTWGTKEKSETNDLILNRTLRSKILVSLEGTVAHSVIERCSNVSVLCFFQEALSTSFSILYYIIRTPQNQSKLVTGKMQAVCIWHLFFHLLLFSFLPYPTLNLLYSVLPAHTVSKPTCSSPCSPAGGSPSAWWTCRPLSPLVCHIPPAGILSGYKVSLAHNRSPLLVGGSPQCGQYLEWRKMRGLDSKFFPQNKLRSSTQDWPGVWTL